MKANFENSVNVLVKAYLNDTLRRGRCSACAVGNLLDGNQSWAHIFVTQNPESKQLRALEGTMLAGAFTLRHVSLLDCGPEDRILYRKGLEAIERSGYTIDELARVEYAFESAHKNVSPYGDESMSRDDGMFNGLLAVVDVLAEIHGVDLTTKQAAVGQFEEIHLAKV